MKRFVIYVMYDPKGIIQPYVLNVLLELRKFSTKLVVVCNFEVEREGLPKYIDELFVRKNMGYDAMAYKEIILSKWNDICKYEELLITNDTYYAPLFSFYDMFDKMSNVKCDYWGITKHPECYVKDFFVQEHIQSYFLVLRRNVIISNKFYEFWENIKDINTIDDAIIRFEIGINNYLSQNGYLGKSYMECNGFDLSLKIGENPYMKYSYELISKYRVPIIKRKSMFFDNDYYSNTIKALKYIHDNTDYDSNLILNNIFDLSEIDNNSKNINYSELNRFVKRHDNVYIYGDGKWAHNLDAYFEYLYNMIPKHIVSNQRGEGGALLYSDVVATRGTGIIIAIADPLIVSDVYKNCLGIVKPDDIFCLCKVNNNVL